MHDPHAEVEIKPQLEPRGSVAKEEDPEPSHQLGKLQVQSQDQLGRRGLWTLQEATESAHRRKRARSDSRGQWRQAHTGVGPDETLSCPTAGPETSTGLEGTPGRRAGLGLPARERTLRAETPEKRLFFACFDLFCRFFWIFSPPSAVVVNLIGTVKSN